MSARGLRYRVDQWKNIGASRQIIDWIENGVKLPFIEKQNYIFQNNHPLTNVQEKFVHAEIKDLLAKGAISEVDYIPHCVNPIGCVPKKGKKWRLICDLRWLNSNIKCPYYKNEGIDTVCDLIQSNDSFVTIDLKDGFQHLFVHKDFRKYLGFQWKGRFYVWNVLPYGLSVSPWYFNKLIREFVTHLRARQLRFSMFVDDGILLAAPSIIVEQKLLLLKSCTDLGLNINWEKSELEPNQTVTYIGYVISSVNPDNLPWIKIPHQRIVKLKRDITRALLSSEIKARFLARICGQLISFTKAILPAKLLLRNLYAALKTRKDWSSIVLLSTPAKRDLEWWKSAIHEWNGRPIVKKSIECQIATDASNIAWGATCENHEAHGQWTIKQCFRHINEKELLAVLLALHSFKDLIKNKHVQILSDNISTVAYINHLGGPVQSLTQIAKNIWTLCYQLGVTLEAKHLAGKKNVQADRLSRLSPRSTYSWSIHPALFRQIDKMWGPHTMDRFADMTNHVCQKYNSLFRDPYTSGIDALAQTNWSTENNFVNAPFFLLPKILNVLKNQSAEATVIAPKWPGQTWYSTLLSLSIGQPYLLPKSRKWISGYRPEPLKNKKWRLYAWRLSGKIL